MGIPGGVPPPRRDQRLQPRTRAGSGPAPQQNIVIGRFVIVTGASGGLFVYSPAPGTGNLIQSIAASNGTDPYGNAYFQGLATYLPSAGHSFVVDLLSTNPATAGFFQYNNPSGGVQGILILAVSATGGTDPVGGVTVYPAGLFGVDPVFGDTFTGVGGNIALATALTTRAAVIAAISAASSSTNPYLEVNAPEQTTASHIQILLQGASPDATHAAQFLIGTVSGATILTPVTSAMMEVQSPGTGLSNSTLQIITAAGGVAGDNMLGIRVSGDANNRLRVNADGSLIWRFGGAGTTTTLAPSSNTQLNVTTGDFDVATAGRGLRVAEGSNAKQGTATLTAGTSGAIANTSVTASSRIFITAQDNNSTGAMRVSARVAGTSFTITSSNAADTGVVAWEMFEPG